MHRRYLRAVLRHKWFVFLAGLRLGVSLRQLVIHDWSKFLPSEWTPYARMFYGGPYISIHEVHGDVRNRYLSAGCYREAVDEDFDRAWLHHQKLNPHHWQYWLGVDLSAGKCDTASGGLCQCLDRHRETANSAAPAGLSARVRTLSTAGGFATFAGSTTPSTTGRTVSSTPTSGEPGTASGTRRTPKRIASGSGTSWPGIGGRFLSTMAGHRHGAPAVASRTRNSLHLTTSKATATGIARSSAAGSADSRPTDGRSRAASRPSSASSATTATPPSASTATVPIRQTAILANDDGTIRCLDCGGTVPREALVPLPIPDKYKREMLADWRGAGRAYGNADTAGWYRKNGPNMMLHPETRAWVEQELGVS